MGFFLPHMPLQKGDLGAPGSAVASLLLVFPHYSWFSVFLNELNWTGYRFIVVCIWYLVDKMVKAIASRWLTEDSFLGPH